MTKLISSVPKRQVEFAAKGTASGHGSATLVRTKTTQRGSMAIENNKWSYFPIAAGTPRAVIYGNGFWLLTYDNSNLVWKSYDGITWNSYSSNASNWVLPRLSFVGGAANVFILCEYGNDYTTSFRYSYDGETWYTQNGVIPRAHAIVVGKYGGSYRYVTTGIDVQSIPYYSTDGINWTAGTNTGLSYSIPVYMFGKFWRINNTSNYARSEDGGATWTNGGLGTIAINGGGLVRPVRCSLEHLDVQDFFFVDKDTNPTPVTPIISITEFGSPIFKYPTGSLYGAGYGYTAPYQQAYKNRLILSQDIAVSSVYITTPSGIIGCTRPNNDNSSQIKYHPIDGYAITISTISGNNFIAYSPNGAKYTVTY